MMTSMKHLCAAAALAAAALAAPATAATTVYTVSGTSTDGRTLAGSFSFDNSVCPDPTLECNILPGYGNLALSLNGTVLANQRISFQGYGSYDKAMAVRVDYGALDKATGSIVLNLATASTADFMNGTLASNALKASLFVYSPTMSLYGLNAGATVSAVTTGAPGSSGQVTAAVPEPATWALMLAGFALTGATLRRGRRRIAAAFA